MMKSQKQNKIEYVKFTCLTKKQNNSDWRFWVKIDHKSPLFNITRRRKMVTASV